jgi:Sec-independent protein translocase protein TatA
MLTASFGTFCNGFQESEKQDNTRTQQYLMESNKSENDNTTTAKQQVNSNNNGKDSISKEKQHHQRRD